VTQVRRAGQSYSLPWIPIQGAIWLVGLLILAWQGWWFPGIWILLIVSAAAQAGMMFDARRRSAQIASRTEGKRLLPHNCPSCNGALQIDDVRWTSSVAATCPYCGSAVELTDDPAKLVR
jgi:hypothetical protein